MGSVGQDSHLVPAIIKSHDAIVAGRERRVEYFRRRGTARKVYMQEIWPICLVHAIRNFVSLPQSMNVGLGYDYTINEYYRIAAEVIGFKGEFVHDLSKPEDETEAG